MASHDTEIRLTLWQQATRSVRDAWSGLDAVEREWVRARVDTLARLQDRLHELVQTADGEAACRDCRGGCCEHGFYHPTLVTIVAHLVLDLPLPQPDFSRSCPYLADSGCLFPPAVRPYNCITFICDDIDQRLDEAQRQQLRLLEEEIRQVYEAFDRRYVGSSLRGLLNRPPGSELRAPFRRQDVLE